MLFKFLILVFCSFHLMAEDDSAIRDKIINKYGDRGQYEQVLENQKNDEVKRKIQNYQKRLKEPLILNRDYFQTLSPYEREQYLEKRREEKEQMSAYIFKHYQLLSESEKHHYDQISKKEEETSNLNLENLANDLGKLDELQPKDKDMINPVKVKNSVFSNMLSGESKKKVEELLNQNPLSFVPKEEIKSMILSRTTGSRLNSFLKNNPKYLEMAIEIFQDKEALSSLASIINSPDKLKKYGFICLFVFVVGFLINLKSDGMGILKKILLKLGVTLASIVCNFVIFYYLFEKELHPTITIIKKYL